MTLTVSATALQKQFGKWAEKAIKEPIAIERQGRESLYLVSAERFKELRERERRAFAVEDMPDDIADLIRKAKWGK